MIDIRTARTGPSRRQWLRAAAAAGVTAAVLGIPTAPVRRAGAQTRKEGVSSGAGPNPTLPGDLRVLTVSGQNVVVMPGVSGALMVNGGQADEADQLLKQVSTLAGSGTIHTLFNTCWHPTQTGSNEILGNAGAEIIAHENARLWLTTDVTWPWDGSRFEPIPVVARPNKTFYDKGSLSIDGRKVDYGHVRASPHTDGDCYVHFRDANVIAVGHAVAGAGWPSIDWRTGGWLGGIVGALELMQVLADDETIIVPAQGPVLRRSEIEEQHEMYDFLYERFVNLLYDGKSVAEAVAARPTAEYDAKMGPSDEFVSRAFQSLWGYLTPDA